MCMVKKSNLCRLRCRMKSNNPYHKSRHGSMCSLQVDDDVRRKLRQESDVSMVTLLQPTESRYFHLLFLCFLKTRDIRYYWRGLLAARKRSLID